MDKKLNEVTKVTDMAYVPVIMSDGSIGQIAKADLASVVAGQIRSDTAFGLTGRFFVINNNETGKYIKISKLKYSSKSRLIAIVTVARVESSPQANVAILDVSAYGSSYVYSRLHSLIGGQEVKAYFIKESDSVSVYVSADFDYARCSIVPILHQNVDFVPSKMEAIDYSATPIEYS